MNADDFSLIAAVNNDEILAGCLARSPDVVSGRLNLTVIRGARCMAEAYNEGLATTRAKYALMAHQDVYLPQGWLDIAMEKIAALNVAHPDWMVAGPYGVRKDGSHIGRVWDVGIGRELGTVGFAPTPIVSLDELLLILRRDCDYRFDETLPDFHLYGTDLVQTGLQMGRSAWAIEIPVVHNSQPVATLNGGYTQAYRFMVKKWAKALPIPTTVASVTRNPIPLALEKWRRRHIPARKGRLLADSVEVARLARYE
ncbi:glycosyltransferase [Porphyrobacter sp. AAP82]|uniref:glycosyltransferase n=1 Tax=Porphyrobacter sp. AAP82 TaxID=1248917 RepID=UPI000527CF1A|nr:glycosyltransferase [Porphyrobacter sp. AAP82]